MDRNTALKGIRDNARKAFAGLAIQGENFDDLLGMLIGVMGADQDWIFAKDLSGDAKAPRVWATVCWQEMMTLTKRIEAMTEVLSRSLTGAVEGIELQDMSEDEWLVHHARALELLETSNKAHSEAHKAFKEWVSYYDKYVGPYRARFLAESSQ